MRDLDKAGTEHSNPIPAPGARRVDKPPLTGLRQHHVSQLGGLDDDILEVAFLLEPCCLVVRHKVVEEGVERVS